MTLPVTPATALLAHDAAASFPVGTSAWWIARLMAQLDARQPTLADLRDYHRGRQSTWRLHSEAARLAFGRTFERARMNLAKPVVDTPAGRLVVEGFRIPGENGTAHDTEAWRIWQANGMDSRSAIAHTEAIAMGECPVIVGPDPDDPKTPLITVEDPMQVTLERDPSNPRRVLAALKRWTEPTGRRVAILYLPDRIEWWYGESDRGNGGGDGDGSFVLAGLRWRMDPDRSGDPPVPGIVPVVSLVNSPRVDGTGEADHETILGLLDALNKTLLDMLTTSEFAAAPQRWAVGVTLDDESADLVDTDDSSGSAPSVSAAPIIQAVNRWVTSDDSEAKFGQFPTTDLGPYIKAMAAIVEQIASITSTPYNLLLNAPTSVPASGEALKAAERALDAKVERKKTDFGETWEAVMRLAFLTVGDRERASTRSETRWRPAIGASEAQHMDALSKLVAMLETMGIVDPETILELVPLSPEQIARVMARRAVSPTVQADGA